MSHESHGKSLQDSEAERAAPVIPTSELLSVDREKTEKKRREGDKPLSLYLFGFD